MHRATIRCLRCIPTVSDAEDASQQIRRPQTHHVHRTTIFRCLRCIELLADESGASQHVRMPQVHPNICGSLRCIPPCSDASDAADAGLRCIEILPDAPDASQHVRMPPMHPNSAGCLRCISTFSDRTMFGCLRCIQTLSPASHEDMMQKIKHMIQGAQSGTAPSKVVSKVMRKYCFGLGYTVLAARVWR